MIKGQTAADSQKFNKQYTHFFSFPLFSRCRLQTTSENGVLYKLCSNFKNDNNQKEARAICSVRQKHSTKVQSAVAQARGQSLFVPEKGLEGGVREEGKVETGGAKSLRAVQVN